MCVCVYVCVYMCCLRERKSVCVCVHVLTEYACKRRDWREREGGSEWKRESLGVCLCVCRQFGDCVHLKVKCKSN